MGIAESAADHLRGSADALAAREPETAEAAFDECARMIATLRDEGLTLSLPVNAAERLFTLGFTREQMLECYAARTGNDLTKIEFYEVFAVFKLAVVLQQIFYRYHRGQTDDARFARLDERVTWLERIATALAARV